jgi:hypothetical protein
MLVQHPHLAGPAPPQRLGKGARRHGVAAAIGDAEQRGITLELVGPQRRQARKGALARQRAARIRNLNCHDFPC